MASNQPLPAAVAKPASLPTVNFPAPFTHTLPENTAGQANVRGNPALRPAIPVIQAAPLPIQPAPLPHMPRLASYPVLMMPSVESGATIMNQQLRPQVPAEVQPQPQQSRSQYYYNKRKQEKELSGVKSRKYTRSDNPIVCGKCGHPRDPRLHKQYFGNWYCGTTEEVSFEEWIDNLKSKGYGKRKKVDK